jgi:hypothetical protein
MTRLTLLLLAAVLAGHREAPAQLPTVKRSDVVFMYESDRQTYADYGATLLAWGGLPTPKALEAARGVKFFGSVGMVTEFARFHSRFPQSYEEGLCRNLQGQPFRVPWLTDHQHQGVPYWWCCTRQPIFRQFLSERIVETLKAGAQGIHIDDHLGTAGSLGSGGCFCSRCVAEFPDFLRQLPAEDRSRLGVADPAGYDYPTVLRAWLAAQTNRVAYDHPLWRYWRVYQFRGAAHFMAELRELAAKTAGHPVPIGANACLLWGPHLSDYSALDLFSAEIEHHAPSCRFDDRPLLAYRLADAVGRPLTSTASGNDWAFIKEHNRPGLVQGWIALGYASGHSLMVPHHQWCYTPQKGTHWYDGPKDKFAPFYHFVRQHPALFDDYDTYADLTVVFSQHTFDRSPSKVTSPCQRLTTANLSYRVALGGDDIVDHPLHASDLTQTARLLVLEPADFQGADRRLLAALDSARCLSGVDQALTQVTAAVRCEGPDPLRLLPRVKPGAAVIHLINWAYDDAADGVPVREDVRLKLDLAALKVTGAKMAMIYAPDSAPVQVPLEGGRLIVPKLQLWALVQIVRP